MTLLKSGWFCTGPVPGVDPVLVRAAENGGQGKPPVLTCGRSVEGLHVAEWQVKHGPPVGVLKLRLSSCM